MRRLFIALSLLLVNVLPLPCSIARAEIVTAALVPTVSSGFNIGAGMAIDPPAPNPFDNRLAQTFVPTVSGEISRVSFLAYQSFGTTAPLRIDIASVAGGLPVSPLATAIVPISSFPTSIDLPPVLNIHADFSATGFVLQAGVSYAIVYSSNEPNANYRIHGSPAFNPYADGAAFQSQNGAPWMVMNGDDLYFEVTVTPVPEPSAFVLAGMGCGLALLVTFSHRSRRSARRDS